MSAAHELINGDEGPIRVEHRFRMQDGVYFDLPDNIYHQAFALGSSGIKDMLVSTMHFWTNCRALNSNYRDQETEAKTLGRAYDVRILSGKEAFDAAYAPLLDRERYPGAYDTVEELKAAIERAGGRRGGLKLKADYIQELARCDPGAMIWETLVRGHAEEHRGKILLPWYQYEHIELAAAMIELDPEARATITDGYAQVSVFWTDPETGVPCKARMDYIKVSEDSSRIRRRIITDLKTYETRGKPVERAMDDACANWQYYIQGEFYLRSLEFMCRFLEEGSRVSGDPDPAFVRDFISADEQLFCHLWQCKGPAPVCDVRIFQPEGYALMTAKVDIEYALKQFVRCWRGYGEDQWIRYAKPMFYDDARLWIRPRDYSE